MSTNKNSEVNPLTSSASSTVKKEIPIKTEKEFFIDKGKSIPTYYGETKTVILPRDPNWIYSYWDISKNTIQNFENKYGTDIFKTSRTVLRIYDVTNINFNGKNANSYFDIDVNLESRNWYLKIDNADRKSYCVDLGLVTKDGKFILIARSNIISMPSGSISNITDEEWLLIQEDFEKLMKLSGDGKIGKSSAEALQMLLNRIEKIITISNIGGSGLVSSFGAGKNVSQAKRGFWLMADAELIVYGATEKDATVTVKGNSIKLKDDGSFHLRFALPDGTNEIPIEATSSDEKEKRRITITVNRNTK